MIVIGPVESFVGVIDGQSGGVVDLCVGDDGLPPSIHANASNVGRFTAVHPEYISENKHTAVLRVLRVLRVQSTQSTTNDVRDTVCIKYSMKIEVS